MTREEMEEALVSMMEAVAEGGEITMTLGQYVDDAWVIRIDAEHGNGQTWDIGIGGAERLADVLAKDPNWGSEDMFVRTLRTLVGAARSREE